MKNYIFDCKGCACQCRIALKDALAVPRSCPAIEGQPDWFRVGEFEKHEEVPGETEALRVDNERLRDKCRALADANAGMEKERIYLNEKYKRLVDWIIAFLGMGVQGIKGITGREVDK